MELQWNEAGKKTYETGVSKGVLYPAVSGAYPLGVAWDGLTGVTESPSGAEAKPMYANNIKWLNLISAESFGATITAFMYPDEFGVLNGEASVAGGVTIGQQSRGVFGLSYETVLGNDADGKKYGYKIHLVYGAQVAPSEKAYATENDSPEPINMSWSVSTTPVEVSGYDPTATLVIDSTKTDAAKLEILKGILRGTAGADARLPLPAEVISIVGGSAVSAIALSTSVPAANATAVAVGANVVLTFNNKIAREAVTLVSALGVLVNTTKTFDAAGKVLTIVPTGNLTASTKYFVTVAGVADVYNQSLSTVVNSFTTA